MIEIPVSATGRAILTALANAPEGLSRYGLIRAIPQFADKSIVRMISTLKTQGFLIGRIDEDGVTRFTITDLGTQRLQTVGRTKASPLGPDAWVPRPWMHPFRKPAAKRQPERRDVWPADPTTMKHPIYPPRKLPPKPSDLLDITFLEIPTDATP